MHMDNQEPKGFSDTPNSALPTSDSTLPTSKISTEDVLEILKSIPDPELGINIVDLGLIYEVKVQQDEVLVKYNLTTLGCGIGPMLEFQMEQMIEEELEVKVLLERVFEPAWDKNRMSEWAQSVLG